MPGEGSDPPPLHRHLDDDLVDFACADQRGVRVVGEEDHELARQHGDVAVGRVGEEFDVLLGIVLAVRPLAAAASAPAHLLDARNHVLDGWC